MPTPSNSPDDSQPPKLTEAEKPLVHPDEKEAAAAAQFRQSRAVGYAVQLPMMMAACLLVSVFIGRELDERLGTGRWMVLLFFLIGMAAAIRSAMRLIKRIEKDTR